MSVALQIETDLSSTEVLARLARFGKEWRESKMPASVRASGFAGCSCFVKGEAFDLRLEGQGRGPQLRWLGTVLESSDGRDRVLSFRAALIPWVLVSYIPFGVVFLYASLTPLFGERPSLKPAVFGVGGMLFVVASILASIRARSVAQAKIVEGVLRAIVDGPSR